VSYIAQVLKRNRTLKTLNLSDNRIEVQGLVQLAEALVGLSPPATALNSADCPFILLPRNTTRPSHRLTFLAIRVLPHPWREFTLSGMP
jgi:hypothetical protein